MKRWNDLSIAGKLFAKCALLLVIAGIALTFEFALLNRQVGMINYSATTLAQMRDDVGLLRRWLLYADDKGSYAMLATDPMASRGYELKYEAALAELRTTLARVEREPFRAHDRALILAFSRWLETYVSVNTLAFTALQRREFHAARQIYLSAPVERGEGFVDELRGDVQAENVQVNSAIVTGSRRAQAGILAGALIAIVIISLLEVIIVLTLTRRINVVIEAMKSAVDVEVGRLLAALRRLAAGDLTSREETRSQPLAISGRDEAARLADAYNTLLGGIQTAEAELSTASGLLASMIDQIKRTADSKMQFSATLSHEIRTPLSGIVGIGELLSRTSLDARQRKYAETIDASARALLQIVNEVLDFSKSETSTMALHRTHFNVRNLIGDVSSAFAPAAAQKGIALTANVAPALDGLLYGDAGRLRQVLDNLVNNAIKFTDRGSVTIDVGERSSSRQETVAVFTVSDTGVGIPLSEQERIFEPFVQAGGTDVYRAGGTGLGLAIVRRIVELMDGEIALTSESGRGSAFRVTVKLGRKHFHHHVMPAQTSAVERTSSSRPRAFGVARPERVLVAEDNEVNRMLALAQLEELGFRADCVGDGVEAVVAARSGDYALIFMDSQMPKLDGLAATREIRASEVSGHRVPIVAMTANASPGYHHQCLDAGMNDYIAKPVTLDALETILERWIETNA